MHRFLEGSALALAPSVMVTAALTVHALAEGLAVGALLGCQPGRRVVGWLAVMCLSPVAGAMAATAIAVTARRILFAECATALRSKSREKPGLTCASPAPVQITAATLSGTVKDETGGILPGTDISRHNSSLEREILRSSGLESSEAACGHEMSTDS